MKIFYEPKTGGFYNEDVHGARTILVPDPSWKRPTIRVPDPSWKRPTKKVPDPSWQPPKSRVPDPAWVRPTKKVPDPAWQRPTKMVPDPSWVRPSFLAPDHDNATPDGRIPLKVVHDEAAVQPMIEVPDMEAQPPMIDAPDMDAHAPMVELVDGTAKAPLIDVPDEDAEQPMLDEPDLAAEHPLIEVPNPDCMLPPEADLVEITPEEHVALLEQQSQGYEIKPGPDGRPILEPRTPAPADAQKTLEGAAQAHLDAQARSLGYDDIKSAVTYADEPAVPKFQAEGQALRAWRSLVWAKCYEILAEVQGGLRPIPTMDELLAELPAFSMPS
jgi:hypothetical protein